VPRWRDDLSTPAGGIVLEYACGMRIPSWRLAMAPASERAIHVLVVEDEFMIAMQLTDWVAAHGWKVAATAASVGQALAVLRSSEPVDAALVDMNLNGHLAEEVIDALEARDIPLVLVTGYTRADLGARFEHCKLVNKPVDFDDLAREFREARACRRRQ
jgi:DNA-binding NtrC family response regulator